MRRSICAGIVIVAAASAANAGLISVDWHTAGDGLMTLDTSTGYKWLDLTATVNYSFDGMTAQLQAGGIYDGFRRASMVEVDQLFTSAGMATRGYDVNLTPAIINLLNFNGTCENGFRIGSTGFTSDAVGLGHALTQHFLAPNESFGAYALAINNGSGVDWANFGDVGQWLIQTPTPGSTALLVMGGMVATRRRRR